jgi:hypothetical protein
MGESGSSKLDFHSAGAKWSLVPWETELRCMVTYRRKNILSAIHLELAVTPDWETRDQIMLALHQVRIHVIFVLRKNSSSSRRNRTKISQSPEMWNRLACREFPEANRAATPMTSLTASLVSVRECLNRQRPFGKADWQAQMASMFGLGSILRSQGRPVKGVRKLP